MSICDIKTTNAADWLLRKVTPAMLSAAGFGEYADELARLPAVDAALEDYELAPSHAERA